MLANPAPEAAAAKIQGREGDGSEPQGGESYTQQGLLTSVSLLDQHQHLEEQAAASEKSGNQLKGKSIKRRENSEAHDGGQSFDVNEGDGQGHHI